MTELPPWWIYASGIFFILGILLFAGLVAAVLKLMQMVKALQDKLESTIKRGEAIVERLEGVAQTAQNTVDSVGGKARGIADKVESVVAATAEKAAPLMTIFMVATTGLKLYQQFTEMRKGQAAEDEEYEPIPPPTVRSAS